MPNDFEAEIEAFRTKLDPENRLIVDALRSIIKSADQRLVEEFKWNAPSFRLGAEHRVTLGLERAGSVRLVLHRGASKKDTTGFEFQDPHKLAAWPAKDRGVLKLKSLQDVNAKRDGLADLITRWLAIPS